MRDDALEDRIAAALCEHDEFLANLSLEDSAKSLLEKLSDTDQAQCESKLDFVRMLRTLRQRQSHRPVLASEIVCLGQDFSWVGQLEEELAQSAIAFLSAWNECREPSLTEFLDGASNADKERVTELICIDIRLRHRIGRGRPVESYLEDWPFLATDHESMTRLILTEYRSRSKYSQTPPSNELESRFPQRCPDANELAIEAVEARGERVRDSYQNQERFYLLRELGAGGMGVVYEAWDRDRHECVALKALPKSHPDLLYYFKREFRFLSHIFHPNLVTLHELFAHSDQWYFTMDFVEGGDLAAFTNGQTPELPKGFDNTEAFIRNIISQLVDAVDTLHAAGTLHRDIKPSNILLDTHGRLVLVDFGLLAPIKKKMSPRGDERSHTDSTVSSGETAWQMVGTAAYMSPEQARGEALDKASDWFSVGTVFWELLAGRQLFCGTRTDLLEQKRSQNMGDLIERLEGVPEDLSALCERLLSAEPAERPTAQEIRALLSASPFEPKFSSFKHQLVPFVGRDEQLAGLEAAFEIVCRQNQTAIATVCGESGTGKSRVIQEFLFRVRDNPKVVVLNSRCYEGEAVAYKAIDGIADALAEYLSTLSHPACCELLPNNLSALARVFPVLRRVLAIDERVKDVGLTSDPHEMRRRAFDELRLILYRIGQQSELILVVDDLQWGDVDSAFVFGSLLNSSPPRLLLLACCRAGQQAVPCLEALRNLNHELIDYFEVNLTPLTAAEAEKLAADVLARSGRFDVELAKRIARESEGIPYFIVELSNSVSRDPSAKLNDLDELVWNRCEQLSPEARRILEIISVAAQPIKVSTVMSAGEAHNESHAILTRLRSSGFISSTGRSLGDSVYSFHDRVRECVVARLGQSQLREYHLVLAESLSAEAELDHEWIGKNYQAADRFDSAGFHYIQAAEVAEEKLAFDRAARLLKLSLALGGAQEDQKTDLQIRLGDALANGGRGFEAGTAYKSAIPFSDSRAPELKRKAAYQFCISGRIQEGRDGLQAVLQGIGLSLTNSPAKAICALLFRRMKLRLRGLNYKKTSQSELDSFALSKIDVVWAASAGLSMFDVIEAASFQTINLQLALQAGEPQRIVRAMAWEAAHTSNAGGSAWKRVQTLLSRAEVLASRNQSDYSEGIISMASGVADWTNGRWAEALPKLSFAESTFRERCRNVSWELNTTQTFLLWGLFYLGEFDDLYTRSSELVAAAQDRGNVYAESTHGTFSYPMAILAAGDPQRAKEVIRSSLAKWKHKSFHVQHSVALMANTYVDLYQGNSASSLQRYRNQWPLLKKSNLLHVATVKMFNLHLRARAALAVHREQPSKSLLHQAQRDGQKVIRSRISGCVPHGKHILAGVALQKGEMEKAIKLLEETQHGYADAKMPVFANAIAYRRGQILGGSNGNTLIQQAKQELEHHLPHGDVQRFCNAIAIEV